MNKNKVARQKYVNINNLSIGQTPILLFKLNTVQYKSQIPLSTRVKWPMYWSCPFAQFVGPNNVVYVAAIRKPPSYSLSLPSVT